MRFILRHDTLKNWEEEDPVLMEAEIVSVKEDGFCSLAIGDGTHPFTKLPRIKLREGLSVKLDHYGNGRVRLHVIEDALKKEEKVLTKEEKDMSENYIVINGKKSELTEEQLKLLGIEVRPNPFERVRPAGRYFYIDAHGRVKEHYDTRLPFEEKTYGAANYFNNEAFAEQVALYQLLYRKLLKFAYDNGIEDTVEWDGENVHWTIRYDDNHDKFFAYSQEHYKVRDIYFSSEDAASRAIKEVVEPFMKEHPEFVW